MEDEFQEQVVKRKPGAVVMASGYSGAKKWNNLCIRSWSSNIASKSQNLKEKRKNLLQVESEDPKDPGFSIWSSFFREQYSEIKTRVWWRGWEWFEWLQLLQPLVLLRLGHEEHEITAAFTRFDQDGDHILDEEEREQMRQGLEEERVSRTVWWARSIYTSLACPPSPPHLSQIQAECPPTNEWERTL